MASAAPALVLPSPSPSPSPPSPRSSPVARSQTPELVAPASSRAPTRLPMPRSSSALSTSTTSSLSAASEPPEKPIAIHLESLDPVAVSANADPDAIRADDDTPFAGIALGIDPRAFKMGPRYYPVDVADADAVLNAPHEGPAATFSFGTCPSLPPVSTPTAELGPFEYPEPSSLSSASSSSSATSAVGPLPGPSRPRAAYTDLDVRTPVTGGITLGRRGSIALGHISRLAQTAAPFVPPVASGSRRPSYPSPPSSRRSSTCSTLTTLPVSGRRPSILHSVTSQAVPGDVPPPLFPIDSNEPTPFGSVPHSPSHPSSPSLHGAAPSSPRVHARQGSIAFAHQPMVAPIPPSLLARRGSLPVSSLFPAERRRSGAATPFPSLPVVPGYTTTTTTLYHRRDSAEAAAAVASIGAQVRSRFPSQSSTGSGAGGLARSSVATSRGSILSPPSEGSHRSGSGLSMSSSSGTSGSSGSARVAHRPQPPSAHPFDMDTLGRAIDESPLDPPVPRTPATPAVASVGFTDPWAAAGAGTTHDGVVGLGVMRKERTRPGLETIPSDGAGEGGAGGLAPDA
ncbi:hypothetical protein Q5752_006336 [Cryptotrichosporon argae]